jgi:hypothetical protein
MVYRGADQLGGRIAAGGLRLADSVCRRVYWASRFWDGGMQRFSGGAPAWVNCRRTVTVWPCASGW